MIRHSGRSAVETRNPEPTGNLLWIPAFYALRVSAGMTSKALFESLK